MKSGLFVLFLIVSMSFFNTPAVLETDRLETPYCKGFKIGWPEGYCYDVPMGCVAPVCPVCPIPRINESSQSFEQGRYRGFVSGKERKVRG